MEIYCSKCSKQFCVDCSTWIHSKTKKQTHKDFLLHKSKSKFNLNTQMFCLEHQKTIEFLCLDCNSLTCSSCVLKGGDHSSHNYLQLTEAKKEISKLSKKN